MWQPQLESPPPGWRVIAPDLRGFGNSPPTAGPVTMDSLADDLAALLAQLGVSSAAVCGLSMGGYVSFAMIRRHPSLVRALVLCDTKADGGHGGSQPWAGCRARLAWRQRAHGRSWRRCCPSSFRPPRCAGSPPSQGRYAASWNRLPVHGVAAALKAMAARPDSSPMLRSVNVPTQIIVGADDQITPAGGAQLMARGIPGARIEVIPEAGHLPNLENTADVQPRAGEFLAGVR
jgi:3-oxoadipate enol-lactonase